jgi:hypothetical protein
MIKICNNTLKQLLGNQHILLHNDRIVFVKFREL